jgi:hypothetical protein
MKNEGLLPGAPDLIVMKLAPDGRPVAIEMKRDRYGKLSEHQLTVIPQMRDEGWIVVVPSGAMDAIRQLDHIFFEGRQTKTSRLYTSGMVTD